MSEKHPRRLPGFLSEEDPDSFTSEREREREFKVNHGIQWLTLWTPQLSVWFYCGFNSVQNAVPPVESAEFVRGFLAALLMAPLIWLLSSNLVAFLECTSELRVIASELHPAIMFLFHTLPKALLVLFHLFFRGNQLFPVFVKSCYMRI